MSPTGESGERAQWVMPVAVVVLVAASGATETISFMALGHVFAGVMTGNLALLGMSIGQGGGSFGTAAVLALTGFGVGAAVVARVNRGHAELPDRWTRRVLACLVAETALLVVGAAFWAAADGAPGAAARDLMQFGASAAMGAQSAAMVAAGRAAASTTYLTGTLTAYIVHGFVGGARSANRWLPVRLAALVAGAAAAMAIRSSAPVWTAALPCALVAAAAVLGSRWRSRGPAASIG